MPASLARVLAGRAPVGVRFLEHTADAAIEVRARSLAECFARAGAGMFAVFVAPARSRAAARQVDLEVTGTSVEGLLVSWLEELLYLSEVNGIAFDTFTVREVAHGRVRGAAEGCSFAQTASLGPAVKGISRHGLEVRPAGRGWRCRLLFDV